MISEAEANILDSTTHDGDVLVIRDQDCGWTAIWRDDDEARGWGAGPGEYWFDGDAMDPACLADLVKAAVEVREAGRKLLPVGISDEDLQTPNWLPLRSVAADLDPWMWVYARVHEGRRIDYYKHRQTRSYLKLDSAGQAYRVSVVSGPTPFDDEPEPEVVAVEPIDTAEALKAAFAWLA